MKTIRRALMVLAASLMVATWPHAATAGVGASAAPEFTVSIRLGDTDLPASLELRNANSDDPDPADPDQDTGYTNTVCNEGNTSPCVPGGRGITLIPSCGRIGARTTCDPAGVDPGVFDLSSTATGSGACAGIDFTVSLVDEEIGMWQFVPTLGRNVTLPGTGAKCLISFTFDVLKLPTIDVNPGLAGIQTAQIVATDQVVQLASENHVVPAEGRGTSVRQVLRSQPTMATNASAPTRLGGGKLTNTAIVSGRYQPDDSATIDFRLYGPDDPTCSKAPVFESLGQPVPSTDGPVTSAGYTPVAAGTHRWVATYSGDTYNMPVNESCNDADDPDDATQVDRARPTLTTDGSSDATVGDGTMTATATITNRFAPDDATVDFRLYGPDDPTCSKTPVFESLDVPYPVAGGPVSSDPFTPDQAGSFRWVITYSGDGTNEPVIGSCAKTSSEVTPNAPTFRPRATSGLQLGAGPLAATAKLSSMLESGSGGTVEFQLHGPNDPTCDKAPVHETLGVPARNATVSSEEFSPTTAGTYRWVASYSGDDKNAAVQSPCGDTGMLSTVTRATPRMAVQASPLVGIGEGKLWATTEIKNRISPLKGATVRFHMFGPNDPACARDAAFVSEAMPYGIAGGSLTSAQFAPKVAGTYRWVAVYSGDANNERIISACEDSDAHVNVTPLLVNTLPDTGAGTDVLLLIGAVSILLGIAIMTTANPRLVRSRRR